MKKSKKTKWEEEFERLWDNPTPSHHWKQFISDLLAKEKMESKKEAYDEFFLAIDKEFENFIIDEAMGKILLKLKSALKSEEKEEVG